MVLSELERRIVVDKKGDPTEVIIPYEKFVELVETYGLDLSDEEREAIVEAEADFQAGNRDAFVSLEELRAEFAATDADA